MKVGGGTPLLSSQLSVTEEPSSTKCVPKGDRETEGWSGKKVKKFNQNHRNMRKELTDKTDGNIG
jgi:hypothetical protein